VVFGEVMGELTHWLGLSVVAPSEESMFHRWRRDSVERAVEFAWSRANPAQMEERGSEMMTRVRTLCENSGILLKYWQMAKMA
jgi:hypothetical protein